MAWTSILVVVRIFLPTHIEAFLLKSLMNTEVQLAIYIFFNKLIQNPVKSISSVLTRIIISHACFFPFDGKTPRNHSDFYEVPTIILKLIGPLVIYCKSIVPASPCHV